jgi:hypothetical protein
MRLGKVVKSNSHCDYVIQVDDRLTVDEPPAADDYGFGSFVKLEDINERHWAVGIIYNSQLINPTLMGSGPRLSTEPDPMFTPDLILETRTFLNVVLIGSMEHDGRQHYGKQGIPRIIVPIETPTLLMSQTDIYRFHLNEAGSPQFSYYSHLLRFGGGFAAQLTQQVLMELAASNLFGSAEQRALDVLCKELAWKNTMGAMR